MDNCTKELTDGMRRLCAVANRIVAADGRAGRLDIDLLMDDLRRLYDVALRMAEGTGAHATPQEPLPDEEMLHSTVMATMAALGTAPVAEAEPEPQPQAEEPQPEPEPIAEPEPVPEPVAEEPEPEPEPAAPEEPEAPAPEPEPEAEPEPVSMSEYERESGLLFDEVIIEPEPAAEPTLAEAEPEPAAPEPIEEPQPEPTPEPAHEEPRQASLLDYLQSAGSQPQVRTIGEISAATATSVGERLAAKVDDLRTVININDKFSFMSELFKNNMRAYNDFIMHLNSLADRAEAVAHVEEVAQQYKWDQGSAAVQAFWKIFDKKF